MHFLILTCNFLTLNVLLFYSVILSNIKQMHESLLNKEIQTMIMTHFDNNAAIKFNLVHIRKNCNIIQT